MIISIRDFLKPDSNEDIKNITRKRTWQVYRILRSLRMIFAMPVIQLVVLPLAADYLEIENM